MNFINKAFSAGVVAAAFIGLSAAHADSDLNDLYPGVYSAKSTAVSKTREQVQADQSEAVRTGDIYVGGEPQFKMNELFPDRYPAKAGSVGKTREQVQAETAEAIRTGDMYTGGDETHLKLNELFPGRYANSGVLRVTSR